MGRLTKEVLFLRFVNQIKMARKLVCICNLVTEDEIIELLKKGALSTEDIQKHTNGGTSCGRCLPEIDAIVEAFLRNKPADEQQKLDFGF